MDANKDYFRPFKTILSVFHSAFLIMCSANSQVNNLVVKQFEKNQRNGLTDPPPRSTNFQLRDYAKILMISDTREVIWWLIQGSFLLLIWKLHFFGNSFQTTGEYICEWKKHVWKVEPILLMIFHSSRGKHILVCLCFCIL